MITAELKAISIRIAIAIAMPACAKQTPPPPEAIATPTDASPPNAFVDYPPAILSDIRDKPYRYDGQRVEIEAVLDVPPAGTTLSPPDECHAHFHALSSPTFPNLDTPDAPECFRLEPGRIADLSSVSPTQQTRARVRGVFHVLANNGVVDDDPTNVLRTSMSVDALDPIEDRTDYGPASMHVLETAPLSSNLARVETEGEWFSYFEGWNLSDPNGPRRDANDRSPMICLQWSPSAKNQRGPRLAHVHARGRLFVRNEGNCSHTLVVDSYDLLPRYPRDGG